MGLFQITIWTTHLNKGISVSDNEIACNWILKKIFMYNAHWHSDRILPRIWACPSPAPYRLGCFDLTADACDDSIEREGSGACFQCNP